MSCLVRDNASDALLSSSEPEQNCRQYELLYRLSKIPSLPLSDTVDVTFANGRVVIFTFSSVDNHHSVFSTLKVAIAHIG